MSQDTRNVSLYIVWDMQGCSTHINVLKALIHLGKIQNLKKIFDICMDYFSYWRTFRGVLVHARWVKCESTEHATTSVFNARNSSTLSLNAKISVGHTNVLQEKCKLIVFLLNKRSINQYSKYNSMYHKKEIEKYLTFAVLVEGFPFHKPYWCSRNNHIGYYYLPFTK